jgi:uncharacterized RDD family membrane protein YckC
MSDEGVSDPGVSPMPPPPPPPLLTYGMPAPAPEPPGNAAPARDLEGIPAGLNLATPARRLGQHLLEFVLIIVTLVIGWIIWSLVIWGDGQTPAMQILKLRVVQLETGKAATWGTMFLREFVGKFLIFSIISFIPPVSLVLSFMLLWDKKRQELWDKVAGTIVVNDPVPA